MYGPCLMALAWHHRMPEYAHNGLGQYRFFDPCFINWVGNAKLASTTCGRVYLAIQFAAQLRMTFHCVSHTGLPGYGIVSLALWLGMCGTLEILINLLAK